MTKSKLKSLLVLLRELHSEYPRWTNLDTTIALVKALIRQKEGKTNG